MSTPLPRPRLRELRQDRGWTQQEVADRLIQLAWTRLREQAAVTCDMVAKWERGKKGASPRYRKLLAALFGVTVDQLGFAGPTGQPSRPDDQSLMAMVDGAAELLNQLGGAGRVVRPQVLAALTDQVLTRGSVLAMLDPIPQPARPATAEATLADLEDLAARYEVAYNTAAPGALLTAVSAQLRIASDALCTGLSTGVRQRFLRNRARVAILAGRLAGEDLGNVMAARAYLGQATDDAHDIGDEALATIAAGYTAQLATREGQPAAALAHLRAAAALAGTDPTITSWLAGIEATAHADAGNDPAARDALGRAHAALTETISAQAVPWFNDHDTARLAAATGHVMLRVGDAAARQLADAAAQLDRIGPAARRPLVVCLIDQAEAELNNGSPDAAFATADRAAALIHRTSYAAGTARLGALRDTLARRANNSDALRRLDDQLANLAAA